MLIFNIPKNYPDLIDEVREHFINSEIVEVDSLGTDTMVQVIVPVLEMAIPAVSAFIVAIMSKQRQVEIEWNGIKIKGTEKQVEKFLHKFLELEDTKKTSTKKKGKSS